MNKKYFLGIDIGTTFLKTAIYDFNSKKCLGSSSKVLNLISNNVSDLHQNPNEYLEKAIEGIRDCIANTNIDGSLIQSISIDGQMGGIMAIDEKFKPVTDYNILHNKKSRRFSDLLNIENGDLVYKTVGCPSSYGGSILYWTNDKKVGKKIKKFIQASGYVVGKLCNLAFEDVFMDHTYLCWSGLADGIKLNWSKNLCEKFGVNLDLLPNIVDPFKIVGYISKNMSDICGIKEGIPVAAGAGDGSVTLFGSGMNYPSKIALIIGTAIGIFFSDNKLNLMNDFKFPNLYSVFRDIKYLNNWALMGRSHFWFIENFFNEKNKSTTLKFLDNEVENLPHGSNKLLFIPYFNGIMQPYKPFFKGAWIGLDFSHNKYYMYRSILESIAYCIYNDSLKIIKFLGLKEIVNEHLIVIGGGAKSDLWAQIFADLFNIKILRYKHNDFATLGSAVIAAKSINEIDDAKSTIDSFNKVDKVFNPVKKIGNVYRKYALFYDELINNMEFLFKRLEKI